MTDRSRGEHGFTPPPHPPRSTKLFAGVMLMGWGSFNLVEGTINHHLLDIHHVNETVARSPWKWWDLAFLLWGAAMLAGGWYLARAGQAEQDAASAPAAGVTSPNASR